MPELQRHVSRNHEVTMPKSVSNTLTVNSTNFCSWSLLPSRENLLFLDYIDDWTSKLWSKCSVDNTCSFGLCRPIIACYLTVRNMEWKRGPAWSAVAIGKLCSSKNLSNFTSGASGKRWTEETEVRKRKYGTEKKSRLSVFSALLTHKCVCWGL